MTEDPIMEAFTLIEETNQSSKPYRLYDNVLDLTSAKTADHELQYLEALRSANEGMIVTAIPANNVPLLAFANAGYATYKVDKDADSYSSLRGYVGPSRQSRNGSLAESVSFAKYHYVWNNEDFIIYTVDRFQYLIKEKKSSEHPLGPSAITDDLIKAVGSWLLDGVIWVFDGYWQQDKNLYRQVQKMSWDKVILDEGQKKELVSVADSFFNSKDVYDDLGVPWKRGLLFHGPPGNGKTISIKALMHTLLVRKHPIPALYVKNAPNNYTINQVFLQARALAPCMLVLEDIETIVTKDTRSYFFNQMDGLESNDGLLVVASTNYLDRLDPGLTSRPSRFDRKYLFPDPNHHERVLYCQYWKKKLQGTKSDVDFPEKLCGPMATITDKFSFAFLQECFVASLLTLAHRDEGEESNHDDHDLDKYELWVAFKEQVKVLRKQIHTDEGGKTQSQSMCMIESAGTAAQEHRQGEPWSWTGVDMQFEQGFPRQRSMQEDRNVLPTLGAGKIRVVNSAAFEMR